MTEQNEICGVQLERRIRSEASNFLGIEAGALWRQTVCEFSRAFEAFWAAT